MNDHDIALTVMELSAAMTGHLTQLRRPLNPQPVLMAAEGNFAAGWEYEDGGHYVFAATDQKLIAMMSQYRILDWQPGDTLHADDNGVTFTVTGNRVGRDPDGTWVAVYTVEAVR